MYRFHYQPWILDFASGLAAVLPVLISDCCVMRVSSMNLKKDLVEHLQKTDFSPALAADENAFQKQGIRDERLASNSALPSGKPPISNAGAVLTFRRNVELSD
jgi:hypothetical protein